MIAAGTWNEHTEPSDLAEIACHVLSAVAADLGGFEELLAGRPGSWEADLVRQIVHGTVGYRPEDLEPWRTESAEPTRSTSERSRFPDPPSSLI